MQLFSMLIVNQISLASQIFAKHFLLQHINLPTTSKYDNLNSGTGFAL